MAGALIALASSGAASAAADNEWKVQLTSAGEAAAQATVLSGKDFGSGTGWSGGPAKPTLSAKTDCANFQPKQSDLVLNGAARAVYKHKQTGWQIQSGSHVLQTARMVQLDWQRTGATPLALACLRATFAKASTPGARFISIRKRPFPLVGRYTTSYRALLDVGQAGARARVAVDIIVFARGRTEFSLISTSALFVAAAIEPAEVRLARLLVSRARA